MPTFTHGKKTKILINKGLFSDSFKEYSAGNTMDTAETSAFGSEVKTYVQGMAGSTLSMSGMYDGAAGQIDAELSTAIGAATETIITIAPDGSFARGTRVISGIAWQSAYQVSGSVGDIVAISAEFQGTSGFRPGVSLKDLVAESATTLHTAVDNTVLTTKGAMLTLHATANTRDGAVTVIVQHSLDGSSYTTLGSFTAIGAATTSAQYVRIPDGTTVNRHVRVSSTFAGTTGSTTYSVNLVRL